MLFSIRHNTHVQFGSCSRFYYMILVFLQNAGDSVAIDELMRSLDKNNDGELSFIEFWQLIGHLARKHGGFNQ